MLQGGVTPQPPVAVFVEDDGDDDDGMFLREQRCQELQSKFGSRRIISGIKDVEFLQKPRPGKHWRLRSSREDLRILGESHISSQERSH